MNSTDQFADKYWRVTQYGGSVWIIHISKYDADDSRIYHKRCINLPHDDRTSGYAYLYPGEWGTMQDVESIEEASADEIHWLEACQQEGTFVYPAEPKIQDNYELF